MFEKIIDYFGKVLGTKCKPKSKSKRKNPKKEKRDQTDDLYPLW